MSNSFLFLLVVTLFVGYAAAINNPVVFIPGLTGSVLQAKRTNANGIPWPCQKDADWYKLWLDIEGTTVEYPCFKYAMSIANVTADGRSILPPGIEVRNPPNTTEATACLDPENIAMCLISTYMNNWYHWMQGKGYTMGFDMDATPFDWRLSPIDHLQPGGLFDQIKERIERMYKDTNRRVTLMGHSMGGFYGAAFLNEHVSQQWKDTYIAQYISVSGVYGGATEAMRAALVGDNEGAPIPLQLVQPIIVTLPGIHALVPINTARHTSFFSPVFSIGSRNYTAQEVPQLYRDLGLNQWADVLPKLLSLDFQSPPNVTVHCMYASTLPTIESVHIDDVFLNRFNPKDTMGPGDGTVPLKSLQVCSSWATQQQQPVYTSASFTSSHTAILIRDSTAWQYIYDALQQAK